MSYGNWKPYVPVATRRANAKREMLKMEKQKGFTAQPIEIQGRKITKSFWGTSWCDHLESFSDFANRLERGRTYVRNGSVCHLDIGKGKITAFVSGSDLYSVKISIAQLKPAAWKKIIKACTGKVTSLLALLQGKLPDEVLDVVTQQNNGLLPTSQEIEFTCDCPDAATMCKHIAASLYGIGARLDTQPELLFTLRGVDQKDLISKDLGISATDSLGSGNTKRRRLASDDLADVFGVEMTDDTPTPAPRKTTKKAAKKVATKKAAKKAPRTNAKKPFEITGANVKKLRKKFGMSHVEFSLLLRVSTPTVQNWEARPGELQLRKRSLEALLGVSTFTKSKAWKELQRIIK